MPLPPNRMSPRADRRGGTKTIALVAVVIVALSVATVHWQAAAREHRTSTLDPATGAVTVARMAPLAGPRRLPRATSVAIVRDRGSDGYYDSPATLDSIVGGWRLLLERLGAQVSTIGPEDSAAARRAEVLVFPAEPCLGLASRRLIRAALGRGQGVVSTWITGTRDGGCATVGWSLPSSLAGAMRLDTLDSRRAVYVTIPGGGALTANVPPGSRLELQAGNHVAARTPTRDLLYSDRMMNPAPARGIDLLDGAVSHARIGAGRSVYLGFDPLRVERDPWSGVLAQMIARNAVAWASNKPMAAIEPWPNGKRAAAMIAQDVETEFENASHAVDSLDAAGVRGTWYVVSQLAERNDDLLHRLARNGEIGSHTENHDLLAGQPLAQQEERLATTQKEIRSLIGHPVAGLRPPEEQFDRNTLRAWLDAGGSYVFGSNDAHSASPELLGVGGDTLVILGRVNNDDVLSLKRVQKLDVGRLTSEYLDAFAKVRALGGFFIMSYHSQFMSRPELVPVVAAVARRVKADTTVWLTTGGEAAAWWRGRFMVNVDAAMSADGTMTVTATNSGRAPVTGAVVRVELPTGWRATGADAATLAAPAGAVRLALPVLSPGATHSITVTLTRGSNDAR
jgi:hypothetical protein